jgi:hypothetical protein
MDISAISMLPLQARADPGVLANDPARLAKEFDALVLRLLLGNLGGSMGLGADRNEYGGAAHSVLGELLAQELAAALDLGLGAALLRSSMEGEQK